MPVNLFSTILTHQKGRNHLPIFRAILTTAINIPAINISKTTPELVNKLANGNPEVEILSAAVVNELAELPTIWKITIIATITETTAIVILVTSTILTTPTGN